MFCQKFNHLQPILLKKYINDRKSTKVLFFCKNICSDNGTFQYKEQFNYSNKNKNLRITKNAWNNKLIQDMVGLEPENDLSKHLNVTDTNQYQVLNTLMCPLIFIPYETQLKIKNKRVFLFLKQFTQKMIKYENKLNLDALGYPCFTDEIIPLKNHSEYLNKDEFSIYYNPLKEITVGYFIGNYNKNVICVEPKEIICCKNSHKNLAKEFQTYLSSKSLIKVSKLLINKTWENFTVRSNEKGEHLCIAKLDSSSLQINELEKEKNNLKNYFENLKDNHNISSFYFETRFNNNYKLELLFGQKKLSINFNNKEFQLSPKSFLPLNLESYNLVTKCFFEDLNLKKSEGLIEIHSFIGLLTVELSEYVKNIYAINSCKENFDDLKQNLFSNHISNVSFDLKKSSLNILSILDSIYYNHTIIINLFPDQLMASVITEIRYNKYIKKLIIISKINNNLLKLFLHLCLESSNKEGIFGLPFTLVRVIPIDSQPYTNTFHTISVFERL